MPPQLQSQLSPPPAPTFIRSTEDAPLISNEDKLESRRIGSYSSSSTFYSVSRRSEDGSLPSIASVDVIGLKMPVFYNEEAQTIVGTEHAVHTLEPRQGTTIRWSTSWGTTVRWSCSGSSCSSSEDDGSDVGIQQAPASPSPSPSPPTPTPTGGSGTGPGTSGTGTTGGDTGTGGTGSGTGGTGGTGGTSGTTGSTGGTGDTGGTSGGSGSNGDQLAGSSASVNGHGLGDGTDPQFQTITVVSMISGTQTELSPSTLLFPNPTLITPIVEPTTVPPLQIWMIVLIALLALLLLFVTPLVLFFYWKRRQLLLARPARSLMGRGDNVTSTQVENPRSLFDFLSFGTTTGGWSAWSGIYSRTRSDQPSRFTAMTEVSIPQEPPPAYYPSPSTESVTDTEDTDHTGSGVTNGAVAPWRRPRWLRRVSAAPTYRTRPDSGVLVATAAVVATGDRKERPEPVAGTRTLQLVSESDLPTSGTERDSVVTLATPNTMSPMSPVQRIS